jgi:hypothetical protein
VVDSFVLIREVQNHLLQDSLDHVSDYKLT